MNWHIGQKGVFSLILLIVCLTIFAPATHALLMSPASEELTVSQIPQSYSISITNDESAALTLKITAVGSFAQLIEVPSSIELQPGESQNISVRVKPYLNALPGTHESGILVESFKSGPNTVSASSALQHRIRVRVPNEGKHLDTKLLQSGGAVGDKRMITLLATNVGTEQITEVYSTIRIDGPQPFSIDTDRASVSAGQTVNLIVPWTPQKEGVYALNVTTFYDGQSVQLKSSASVGKPTFTIDGLVLGDFSLGDPFKLSITLSNNWSEEIAITVAGEISQNNASVHSSTTGSVILQPYEQRAVPVYLESNRLKVGEAQITVSAVHGSNIVSKTEKVYLNGRTISREPIKQTRLGWIIVLVLCLLLALMWFWMRKPRKRRKNGGDNG